MITVNIEQKNYDEHAAPVLKNIHLQIKTGEFVVIVAPSGAGKTTLLNMMAGIDAGYTGAITNKNGTGFPKCGFMFQDARLLPWKTALENIAVVLPKPGSHHSLQQAGEMLARVGLRDCAGYYPAQLSGGMQRRLALARALVVSPDWLLLDEPLISLDAKAAFDLEQLILDLWHQRHNTVVCVTHRLDEAIRMADRVIVLSTNPATIAGEWKLTEPRPRAQHTIDCLKPVLEKALDNVARPLQ